MIKVLGIVVAIQFVALGVGGYFLKEAWQDNAKLQQSVDALTAANKAKADANRSRARTEQETRQLAPADKRSWLLGKPPDPKR